MPTIMKVLDKGDLKRGEPRKVLARFSLDANELVTQQPERFSIVSSDTPHQEDEMGDPVGGRRRKPVQTEEDE